MAVKKTPTKQEALSIYCPSCGRTRTDRQYYRSSSPKYKAIGFVNICKDCIKDYFVSSYNTSNDFRVAIIATCSYADIPFDERNILPYNEDDILNDEDAIKLFYGFITQSGSIGKKLLTTDYFNIIPYIEKNEESKDEEIKLYPKNDLDIEVDDEVIRFFGAGFTYNEYQELLISYLELIRSFDASDYTKILQFKDISYINLKISQAKARNAAQEEVIKMVESRNKLFEKAGLLDIKNKVETEKLWIGDLIHKFENTKPIADPLPEWNDNKISQIMTLTTGHLMRMEGHKDKVLDEYNEIIAPYSVELMEDGDFDE